MLITEIKIKENNLNEKGLLMLFKDNYYTWLINPHEVHLDDKTLELLNKVLNEHFLPEYLKNNKQ